MNNDLISRSELKKDLKQYFTEGVLDGISAKLAFNQILHDIDNAPAVDTSDNKYLEERDADAYETGYLQGHIDGYKKAESDYQKGGADMMQEAAP